MHHRRAAQALFSFIFILLVGTQLGLAQSEKFEPLLSEMMNRTEGPVPAIVVLEPVAPITTSFWGQPSADEVEYYIKKETIERQWQLRQVVNEWAGLSGGRSVRNIKYFWTTNSMMIEATPEVLWEIAQVAEVTQLVYDRKVVLSYGVDGIDGEGEYTWGLRKIRIPELRSQHPELLGTNVVVGILDTGIDANHPELKGKVVAFKDFINSKDQPYDDNGHGTHVAGTIAGEGAGGTQIGIAPRARLVIGKILSGEGSGSLSGILRGMDWIANPNKETGSPLRPRVVNNSWGGQMSQDVRKDPFSQAVLNWVQLNIFPSFAAGNEGPSPQTLGSPGGLPDAFAVGATTEDDTIAQFSSRGPVEIIDAEGTLRTIMKPEVSAPGDKVYSSLPGGKYAKYSGTSMATPHITGVIALLVQVNPQLTVAGIKDVLMKTAIDLGSPGQDADFGAGRVDVVQAVEALEQKSQL